MIHTHTQIKLWSKTKSRKAANSWNFDTFKVHFPTSLKLFNKTVTLSGGREFSFEFSLSKYSSQLWIFYPKQAGNPPHWLKSSKWQSRSCWLTSLRSQKVSCLPPTELKPPPSWPRFCSNLTRSLCMFLSRRSAATTHSIHACPLVWISPKLPSSVCVPNRRSVNKKDCHTPATPCSSLEPARVWSRAGRRPCLQHVCYCVAAGKEQPKLFWGCCCCCCRGWIGAFK